jgi:hypothetical protein
MDPSATTPGFGRREIFTGRAADRVLRQPASTSASGVRDPIIFQPITKPDPTKPALESDLKSPVVKEPFVKEPIVEEPLPIEPVSRGGAPPENPISQGILNLLFICFLYWVSTKILLFYGISNDIYLVYFMFYVFLYVTTLLLPTTYERFD